MKIHGMGCAAILAFGLLLGGCGGDDGVSGNTQPVANAGSTQSAFVGSSVALDGSASTDADGNTLTYSWTITSKPTGSTTALSSATAQKPTFTPDVAGSYVFQLVVNDGFVNSGIASVTVTAVDAAPITTAAPSVSGTISGATTFSVTINKVGTGYYLVLPTAAAAPTVAELVSTGTAFAMSANVAASQAISGLNANTSYTIYFVATDTFNNIQSAVQSVAITTTCMAADADIVAYNFGTVAPPAAIGSYTMQPFDLAAQNAIADSSTVTTIPGSPIPGDLTLSASARKGKIGGGWKTWSHGYTGPVYIIEDSTRTLTLPTGTRAFYFYAEPSAFGAFAMTVTTNTGTTCGPVNVSGSSGATGFGFSATTGASITSITITAPAGANGFAIGEFAISN